MLLLLATAACSGSKSHMLAASGCIGAIKHAMSVCDAASPDGLIVACGRLGATYRECIQSATNCDGIKECSPFSATSKRDTAQKAKNP